MFHSNIDNFKIRLHKKLSFSKKTRNVRDIKILLKAYDMRLYIAWMKYFSDIEQVEIYEGDILAERADAIVSPANSFGYMDGGLDLKYSQHFGWGVERKLRKRLEEDFYGEIPVGQAVIVETDHPDTPYLISAPTMRVPMNIANTVNAYLAFKAILQAVASHNEQASKPIKSLLCPGLGTGEGRMPYERCARQMYQAYRTVAFGKIEKKGGLAKAVENHMALMK
jgi:O-acetyl-ADP-ribose deacetylase (regulator of RNase III)